jgi:hypothetical protein
MKCLKKNLGNVKLKFLLTHEITHNKRMLNVHKNTSKKIHSVQKNFPNIQTLLKKCLIIANGMTSMDTSRSVSANENK